MGLDSLLEDGRRNFLDALRDIPAARALIKPGPNGWSVVECIEHVIAVERRYQEWLLHPEANGPRRDSSREMRFFATMRSREVKVETPERFYPDGRFRSLRAALAEFQAVRGRSVEIVKARGNGLYQIGVRHPFFGEVNGGELVHLLDAHARRHAEQIEEIYQAVTRPAVEPSRAAPVKKIIGLPRMEPEIPDELAAVKEGEAELLFEDGESVRLRESRLERLRRPELALHDLELRASAVTSAQLADGKISLLDFEDVRLTGCDLANLRISRLRLVRVEFVDCRLTGLTAKSADCHSVLIRDCDASYLDLRGGDFHSCEFVDSNLRDADLQGADLRGAKIRGANLARADLRAAKLDAVDFRGSQLDEMLVGMTDLQGAIVDPAQAIHLSRLLGLRIL